MIIDCHCHAGKGDKMTAPGTPMRRLKRTYDGP